MIVRFMYKGTLNGVKGVWTDTQPDGVIVDDIVKFITADDSSHELQNKETKEIQSSVIIQDESEIDNWEEVEREKPTFEKEIDNG